MVRFLGSGPHTPTRCFWEYSPGRVWTSLLLKSCIVYSLRLHCVPIRQMTKSQLEFFRMLDQKIDAVSVIFWLAILRMLRLFSYFVLRFLKKAFPWCSPIIEISQTCFAQGTCLINLSDRVALSEPFLFQVVSFRGHEKLKPQIFPRASPTFWYGVPSGAEQRNSWCSAMFRKHSRASKPD